MSAFDKLADLFRQFPGIGPRQAKRFVYFLLAQKPEFIEKLSELSRALKKEIAQCKECFRFFQKRSTAHCPICADPNRNTGELMVVAKDTDLEALEKSGAYHGRYFVLGGLMPLVASRNSEPIRTRELTARVSRAVTPANAGVQPPLKEVILALSSTTEGEYTADELRRLLPPLLSGMGVRLTTLGRGLSTGSELEYADKDTLASALKNRSAS